MNLLDIIGNLSNILGAIGGVYAFLVWLSIKTKEARAAERIEISISIIGGSSWIRTLPVSLRRRDLTRAELLGRIGMVPMVEPGRRFSIGFLGTPAFLEQLDEVISGQSNSLVIPATPEEFNQFLWPSEIGTKEIK